MGRSAIISTVHVNARKESAGISQPAALTKHMQTCTAGSANVQRHFRGISFMGEDSHRIWRAAVVLRGESLQSKTLPQSNWAAIFRGLFAGGPRSAAIARFSSAVCLGIGSRWLRADACSQSNANLCFGHTGRTCPVTRLIRSLAQITPRMHL
jgi:hypothetical protein